jgi:hypothetical protein
VKAEAEFVVGGHEFSVRCEASKEFDFHKVAFQFAGVLYSPRMAKKRPTRSGAKSKTYRVFVSHATADKWLATVICEKLESVGVTTFRDDRDINGGDDIPEEIRDAINDCNELLVVLTPESVDRPWVLFEVELLGDGRRCESQPCYAM